MSHSQLSKEERIVLEAHLSDGLTQEEAAVKLGRSKSTISREIERNSDEDIPYNARVAHAKTKRRRYKPPKKLEIDQVLRQHVVDRLIEHDSPEQIAGHLKEERGKKIIHLDTIYWWIYQERRDLIPFLRQGKKRRWRRKHGTRLREKQRELAKKRWIHERPEVIETRKRVGDWEGDTVVGSEKTERIATYADRKSGYLVARRTTAKAQDFRIQTKIAFRKIPKKKKITCTYDNGSEMAEHEMIERDTGMIVYFAHPYSSWERGTNENTNGLLREFFPKKMAFASITQRELDRAVSNLNNRPRKRLNYRTPTEVFFS